MHYISPAEARPLPGLRLVLTAHFAAPWCEAAKAVFRLRGVPFVPVEQIPFERNEDLVAWTGIRNAPIAIYEQEVPRPGWLEIALLAERLGSGPSLLPADPRERALCLGISTEIAGEDGLGWTCRMRTLTHLWGTGALPPDAPPAAEEGRRHYRYSAQAAAEAPQRLAEILKGLSDQMADQRAAGSAYLVGDRLSLADVLWATFATFVAPPPDAICPIPEFQRGLYAANAREVAEILDPALLQHRDMVLERHIGVPMEF